jgi:type IV pilus assembly protein PilA
VEPSLQFKAAGVNSTGPKEVSVSPTSTTDWVAAVKSASGNCYFIKDQSNGPGTSFATDTNSAHNCQAGDVTNAGTFSSVGFP